VKNRKHQLPPLAVFLVVSLGALGAAAFAGCSVSNFGGGTFATDGAGGTSFAIAASSGTGFTGAATGSGGPTGGLGASCASDTDCGSLLNCLGPTSKDPIFGGGPAGGFCTKVCDKDTDCPGDSVACLKNSNVEPGRCTLTCTLGPTLAGYRQPLDPSKCRGREDLRCEAVKGLGAVCLPTCGSDSQCAPSGVCDPNLAVCVTNPSLGLPTGAKCDPNAMPTACAGRCIPFDPGVSICSSPCVLGGDPLLPLDCGGPAKGLCAFGPTMNGAGDLGFCTPSCEAHSDCQNPAFWCFTVTDFTALYHKGYCFAATPCNAQIDCEQPGQVKGYTCTITPSGSFCLDASFPLKNAGADGGAGAGAGGAGGAGSSSGGGGGGSGGAGGNGP
jgi:hypothetical protein